MSDLFSSGAFGILPMLLSGGSGGGGNSTPQPGTMTAQSRQPPPVNANMSTQPNYWNGNNFTVPGYSTMSTTSQFPGSMLPAPGTGALAGLTPGQLQGLMANVLKPGQQPAAAMQVPQGAPQLPGVQGLGGFAGGVGNYAAGNNPGGNANIQAILDRLRAANPGMGPNIGTPRPLIQQYA